MTVKYNVSGAKARNGAVITPMDFDDKRAAERFANYHGGIAVHANLREHSGKVQAVSYDIEDFAPTAEDNANAKVFFKGFEQVIIKSMTDATRVLSDFVKSGDNFRIDCNNGQTIARIRRRQFEEGSTSSIAAIVDIKVLTDGIEPYKGPTCKAGGEHGPWADNHTYCITCGYYDTSRAEEDEPVEAAPVGNQVNKDLEEAYAMGFRTAREIDQDDFEETQEYADQRRSDLKELISFDRSIS